MSASCFWVNLLPFGISSVPRISFIPCEVLPAVTSNSLSTSIFFRAVALLLKSSLRASISAFSSAFDFLFFKALEYNSLPITTPLSDGDAFSEASFTSPALSPKIARSSFSSGVGSVSPFGVILPIMMSPGIICAPRRIIPFASRFLVASSDIFGISEVSSSIPRLVSRTSSEYSDTCTEVNMSSRTTFSFITMASS